MINSTLIKTDNKTKADLEFLLNSIYLLPQWEKIKEFVLQKKSFWNEKSMKVDLYRKFSSKNMIEKYSVRTENDKSVATMDLKVYKDSVYIISIDIDEVLFVSEILEKLIQTSIEKALFNTTDKEVKINVSFPLIKQHKIRHLLEDFGFAPEENQSKYEIEMFGETYFIRADKSDFWAQKIKENQILINE
ncbi:hypothetical protein II906_04110 [bacterium]|nr:hypothetical protein [bacterium]